ncbi:MAG: hypothetical protein ACREJ6_02845 [Candidatus Methylomirabilis sp.]
MKRLFLVTAITSLLLTMASISWAASNLNLSKSNVNRVVSTLPQDVITRVLAQLDTKGPVFNEETVRGILRKIGGGQLDTKVKKIVILPPRGTPKLRTTLLLENLADEGPAMIAVSEPGVPADKPSKPIQK